MDSNGNLTSTAATDFTPAGATVGASPAPEQQGQDTTRATATALSEILSPPVAEDTSGQQAESAIGTPVQGDPQPASQAVPRDQRAVEGRHKEDIRKAKRDGYNEAYAELEGKFSAMIEAQLVPYRAMLEQQAVDGLLREYPNMPPELARELAQARAAKQNALPAQEASMQPAGEDAAPPQGRQRDAQGRFAAQAQPDDGDEQQRAVAKAQQLKQQAQEIQAMYGIDMLPMFEGDEEIRRGIVDQDRDFYWGLAVLDRRQGGAKRSGTPPVVRQPNFTGQAGTSFKDMSDAQLEAVQERLRRGEKIDPRR